MGEFRRNRGTNKLCYIGNGKYALNVHLMYWARYKYAIWHNY